MSTIYPLRFGPSVPNVKVYAKGTRKPGKKIDSDVCEIALCGKPRVVRRQSNGKVTRSAFCAKHLGQSKRKIVKDGSVDRFRTQAPPSYK